MKILVICTRRVGDVFLATSAIHALRARYPDAQLDALVFRGTESGLLSSPEVDNVISIAERTSLAEHLKFIYQHYRQYKIAISLLPGDRPTLYSWLFGKKRYGTIVSRKQSAWKRCLLHSVVEFDGIGRHTLVMYRDIIASLLGKHKIAPQIPEHLMERDHYADEFNQWQFKNRYVVMHLTPKFRYKEWPIYRWKELIQACLDHDIGVVLSGLFDEPHSEVLSQLNLNDNGVLNLLNRAKIDELVRLIYSSGCYVGTDTAVTHMAAATGTPTIAIFGPSSPLVWGPWPAGHVCEVSPWAQIGSQSLSNVTLVQGSGNCVPCLQEGCHRHVNSGSDCLSQLGSEQITSAMLSNFK
ncbi:glycosyltransferase family 9 protein [Burkholderiales bacterium]|nr:glycosyltransferase family 9 protein [Burkholderiales bacterium]